MTISSLDHVAIPAADVLAMLRFYRALGFSVPTDAQWSAGGATHFAIQFGDQKINVHAPELWQRQSFTLRGAGARPGCGDFCFVWSGSPEDLRATLQNAGAVIEEGPVTRLGGRGGGRTEGTSVYTRDPDRNLLEFIVYDRGG